MRVLVACESSGTVRDAFIRGGHEAMSCDLLPTDAPGPHYQGDVFDVIDYPWDLMMCATSAIMITWNMHSYLISPLTAFPATASLKHVGGQDRSITDSRSMTYGKGCATTNVQMDTKASICVTDMGNHAEHTFTFWLPKRLSAKSHSREQSFGILMEFLQKMRQVILPGERISKTRMTSETTVRGTAGTAGNLRQIKETSSNDALHRESRNDCLLRSLGLVAQRSRVSLMAQPGMVS